MKEFTTADMTDAINLVADALDRLGTKNRSTKLGAIETLADHNRDGMQLISESLDHMADAIDRQADALQAIAKAIETR